jgi:2',3'-cyclic-nucleotide 2'-phosphodiesterase (5'-nucleotidase family)
MTKIDTTVNATPPAKVVRLMDTYRPKMTKKMMEVVGFAPVELRSFRPQSPLSNFAVDALWNIAQKYSDEPVDFSVTNFGGLRASFPKGDVRLYDIYAVFPFENTLVIIDLDGKEVKALFDRFVSGNRWEALGNVEVEVTKGKISKLMIAGAPFDVNRRYRVATIDFLLGGGDGVAALQKAVKIQETGVMLRDVVIQYISMLQSEGREIDTTIDKRIVIK